MKNIIAIMICLLFSGCYAVTESAIDSAFEHYNEGVKKLNQGDYEGAKKEGEKSLSKVGTAKFNNQGCLPMGQEWNQWLDDSIDRIVPLSRFLITEAEYRLGMYDAAIKNADEVVKYCNKNNTWNGICSDPYQHAIYMRGASYFGMKNYPAAEKDFLWVKNASEKLREEAAYNLAAAYANQGKYDAAEAEADRVIQMGGPRAGKATAMKQEIRRMRGR